MFRILSILIFTLCVFMPAQPQAQNFFWEESSPVSAPIESIKVDGNQRIEKATIESYLDIAIGDRVTRTKITRSVKSLFSTGLFADVEIDQRGSTLFVSVTENPIINQIAFEGNLRIKDDELKNEITLRPRNVLTRTKVQSDVERVSEIYRRKGRFSVFVDAKIIVLDQNRVNLVFEINEGPVTKIQNITFIGNDRFSDGVLRDVIASQEEVWYKFLSSADRYDPDRLNYDQELLRRFYLKNGYADFRVLSSVAELSKDKESFFITITLEEGKRYKVGSVKLDSRLKDFDADAQLTQYIETEKGDWYDADEISDTVDTLVSELGNRQYAFVDVRPNVNRNSEERTVDVTFIINETPRVFVERIEVKGNVRTLDKVVRREFELVEGDPFNKERLAESEKNIKNLGYFSDVKIETIQGSTPDKTIIETSVTEQSTGEVSIGAGFSTQDGPLADFRIRERNLLGTGRELGLSTVVAGERSQFDVSLTEPYLLNRDLRGTVNLFHTTRDYQDESSFDQTRTGGGYSIEYPLAENLRQRVGYRLENNKIEDVDNNASLFIQLQEGTRTTSAGFQRLTYDTRDNRFTPSDGQVSWLESEIAGIGGDARYVSFRTGSDHYFELWDDGWVLNLLGEIGHIQGLGKDVQISERTFIGGNTLRGFERSGIGPRDLATGDALGGNSFYRGTVEVSTPLEFSAVEDDQNIRLHAFSDYGSLFGIDENNRAGVTLVDDASLRVSAGVGLSWASPFGPLRFDLARPIVDEEYDEEELFRFNFGTRF